MDMNMDMDMDTSTTMASMASTTTSMAMAMPSSTTTTSSMDMSSTSMSMTMTFFTSTSTPLYSLSWAPATTGQYAGTCIFLIVLTIILRFLLALKPILETRLWADSSLHHTHTHAHIDSPVHTQPVTPVRDIRRRWAQWRINPAAGRATLELAIAGVGYLLMLAVMTMNVGYFLSVLGGMWLGTFVLGGLAADNWWAHC
ncbi:hypothetical protein BO70DRAFT_426868 [Aspergillus heteromorphus CBS 117.55]|uniref:Copper transport protein n=1 Tax=Aspergillus heteromorphus CBS 117.55 TaxID=1448321 RepID=A0A317WYF1_9EURO|nr:uncharacterized protein BO70DRAFT_426868 [Aspergillus heteromorphus CBS 117.55]PWY89230.1 hypothetical protein BO70DRAFT_426868 [Aspergillus heteromorphus CBS 117.55]